jgi:hypothetical protein
MKHPLNPVQSLPALAHFKHAGLARPLFSSTLSPTRSCQCLWDHEQMGLQLIAEYPNCLVPWDITWSRVRH